MGRELQKKKNKSSIPKKRQKAPSKKKLLQNHIVAKHWSQKETLSQNYRRIGLVSRLNRASGGTEKSISILGLDNDDDKIKSPRANPTESSITQALHIVSKLPTQIQPAEIEVERDLETGAILRVVDRDGGQEVNPLNDLINELENSDDQEEQWNIFAMVPERKEDENLNPVIRQLEDAAANGVRKAPRTQSQREQEWVESLVSKHGEDYEGMMRDQKLNPMQQTAADIRKRVRKWKLTQD